MAESFRSAPKALGRTRARCAIGAGARASPEPSEGSPAPTQIWDPEAGEGRLVLALEGGYHLEANAACAAACMRVLLGEPPAALPARLDPPRSAAQSDLEVVRSVHVPYWRCMNKRRLTF